MANSEMNTELLAQLQQLLAQLTGQLESGYDENGEPVTRYLDGVEAAWKPEKIFQIENGHPLDGGRDGHLNRPNRDMLACIMWLKGKMDEVAAAIPGTEQFETLVDELSQLDVTLLEEKLTYLQGYQTLTNRYAKDKFWVELFSAKNTLADVFEIAVEEAITGSDCIDVTDTVGIEPGTEYLISDSLGCEEITVTQKLTEHRIRTEEPLSRTYGEDAVIRRTSWSLPNFGSMGGDAVAQTGEVYWSVPITLAAIGREQAVYIGRDKEDGVLEIYYMDDQTEDWVELEYLTEISLSTIRRDMKYKLPPITGPLHLKVVCTEGPVRLHHIVTHLAFDANVPQETPSVDWGQIFGDITQQTDLQNALNALMPPDATTAKKGLVELATDAEMSEGTNPGVVPTVKQVSDKVAAASPVGKFDWHCGQTPPDGYLVCDGSALPRAVYPELFAVIGTKFGAGDGKTTFNIPRIPDFIRGAVGGRAVGSKQAHGAQRQSGYRMEASRGSETIHIQKIQFSATSSDVVADPTSAVISSVSVLFAKQLAGQVASYPLASFGNVYPPFNEAAENRPDNVALLPCIKY